MPEKYHNQSSLARTKCHSIVRVSISRSVLVRVQPWQPFSGCIVSSRRLVRNEEVAGATPATLTTFGRQADISWLHLSRKQDRHRRGRSVTNAFRQTSTPAKGHPMKPVLRYQSQLLFRRSYKPSRLIRIRPVSRQLRVFLPARAGVKPVHRNTS